MAKALRDRLSLRARLSRLSESKREVPNEEFLSVKLQ